MSSESASLLKKGDYKAPTPSDSRGPCPVANSFANHGLIERDGRSITYGELRAALRHIGMGPDTASALTAMAFKVHSTNPTAPDESKTGLRDRGQVNKEGADVVDLEQFGRPNALEHDVSLSRQDRAIGDPIHLDPKLFEELCGCAADGKSITIADIGQFRERRHEEQKKLNDKLKFGSEQHLVGVTEAAALLGIFGKGMSYAVPLEYVKALFGESRLPFEEGWSPRWTPLTVPETLLLRRLISRYVTPPEDAVVVASAVDSAAPASGVS